MQNKIVYVCFGGEKYYCQVRYSVLTLLHLLLREARSDVQIVIYTDRPDPALVHPLIRTIEITAAQSLEYKGPLDYVHRLKPAVLQRAEVEIGLPFIYVDSDTRWVRLPDVPFARLASDEGVAYMHQCEGEITAQRFAHYHRLLRRQRPLLTAWQLPVGGPWTVWNAGTIGLPASAGGFFARTLEITDRLLPLTRRRTWVEQLAISLEATRRFRVEAFDAYLQHHWTYSAELPVLLQRLFASWPPGLDIAQRAARCAAFEIRQADVDAILHDPAHRLRVHRGKLRTSLQKRRMSLRLLATQLRNAGAALLRSTRAASIRTDHPPQRPSQHEPTAPPSLGLPDRQERG